MESNNKDFEKKLKRLSRLNESGLDYIDNLKEPCLTYGFWNRYGHTMVDILDDLYENYSNEYRAWCESNNRCYGHSVPDIMC